MGLPEFGASGWCLSQGTRKSRTLDKGLGYLPRTQREGILAGLESDPVSNVSPLSGLSVGKDALVGNQAKVGTQPQRIFGYSDSEFQWLAIVVDGTTKAILRIVYFMATSAYSGGSLATQS
jgi:hypothetical protein